MKYWLCPKSTQNCRGEYYRGGGGGGGDVFDEGLGGQMGGGGNLGKRSRLGGGGRGGTAVGRGVTLTRMLRTIHRRSSRPRFRLGSSCVEGFHDFGNMARGGKKRAKRAG